MSDGYRPTFPRPSPSYDINDQMNLRREIQRALDFKLDRNEFDIYVKNNGNIVPLLAASLQEALKRIEALEARVNQL